MKTRLVPLLLALSLAFALAACGDDGNTKDFQSSLQNNTGAGSGSVGDTVTIPKGFPVQDVPLPTEGRLASKVVKNRGKDQFFSLTYKIAAPQANRIAAEYRKALRGARYSIKGNTLITSTDGQLTTFTAIGKLWDVLVYSGRNNLRERPRLSVDVSAHGTTTESVPTSDDTVPTLPPDPTVTSSTTTTTRAFGA